MSADDARHFAFQQKQCRAFEFNAVACDCFLIGCGSLRRVIECTPKGGASLRVLRPRTITQEGPRCRRNSQFTRGRLEHTSCLVWRSDERVVPWVALP